MRLLLDEMLSPKIARELRERGHDVRAVNGDPQLEALADPAIFEVAQSERRALVTNNVRDFRPLQARPGGAEHFGLIFLPGDFRRTKADIGRIVQALDQLLQTTPDEAGLRSSERWL